MSLAAIMILAIVVLINSYILSKLGHVTRCVFVYIYMVL